MIGTWPRLPAAFVCIASLAGLAACGGGSGSSTPTATNNSTGKTPVNNVQPIVANSGAPSVGYVDGAFTSVTICVPGSSACQTIDNVLVDTGSMGLRLLASNVTLALPQAANGNNTPIVECNQFVDGYTWGPVRTADVKLAGEVASSVPVQIIGDAAFSTVPSTCSSAGPAEDSLSTLGANGVLGVGPFRQDCGPGCALAGSSNPGLYYTCTTSTNCAQAAVSLNQQVQNPVWMFAADNNGVLISLASVPDAGAPSVSGSMIFGIGTQSNNSLGKATVLGADNYGNISTSYKGQTYSGTYIDSGSNGYFFLDSNTTGLPLCSGANNQFYCPASTQSESAINIGVNGTSSTVTFNVANANTLFGNAANYEFSNVAGPNSGSFDFGLPFFFGRNVFTAIEGQSTPAGVGPFFAY